MFHIHETTVIETFPRCPTAPPSSPHVSTYIITPSDFVVQRRPQCRDLPSFLFGFQPPRHFRSRTPLGTDAPHAKWHVLPYLLYQSLRYLQATQDLALRNLAFGSARSLGVRTLLIPLISFIITNVFTPPPPHMPGCLSILHFVHTSSSCTISSLMRISPHLVPFNIH